MIRILLVDDDALVRAGLGAILGSAPDIDIVGELDDGCGVLAAVASTRPDVVLMDIRMPQVDGLVATRAVTELDGAPKVLVLTTFHVDEYVFGALEAGASGFLLKDTPPRELIDAVRIIAAGHAMLSPQDTRALINRYAGAGQARRRARAQELLADLSPREQEVAREVAMGYSNAQIASRLYCSEATVKAHLTHVFAKVGFANRVRLALLAHDAGLDSAAGPAGASGEW